MISNFRQTSTNQEIHICQWTYCRTDSLRSQRVMVSRLAKEPIYRWYGLRMLLSFPHIGTPEASGKLQPQGGNIDRPNNMKVRLMEKPEDTALVTSGEKRHDARHVRLQLQSFRMFTAYLTALSLDVAYNSVSPAEMPEQRFGQWRGREMLRISVSFNH